MFERILVPLDGTRLSRQALPYAIDMARKYGTTLVLVRVVPPEPIYSSGFEGPAAIQIMAESARKVESQNMARARRYLTAAVQSAAQSGVKAEQFVVRGNPSDEIGAVATKEKVDLVVMTTHGRSGLRRAWLGSVADALIRNSGTPVLVIRPEAGK